MTAGFLSINSLAEYLDTTPQSVRRLVDKGVLPRPVSIGGMKRWDVSDVRASIGRALDAATTGRASSSADPDECLRKINAKRKGGAQASV